MAEWVKWGEYAIKNETHSICKAMVGGVWVYSLYELPGKLLGHYPSADAAKLDLKGMLNG